MTGNETCKWIYRPGIREIDHFAVATCDHDTKYLSKITGAKQEVGCADFYNGKMCPVCKKPIKMDYVFMENELDDWK